MNFYCLHNVLSNPLLIGTHMYYYVYLELPITCISSNVYFISFFTELRQVRKLGQHVTHKLKTLNSWLLTHYNWLWHAWHMINSNLSFYYHLILLTYGKYNYYTLIYFSLEESYLQQLFRFISRIIFSQNIFCRLQH